MADDEIKNVLVVGAPGTESSKFIKTFGAYLSCNTHEEAIEWEPNVMEYSYVYDDVKDITKTTMLIERKTINFIYTSNMNDGKLHASKQIMLILLHYLQKQKLSAIIFIVNVDEYEKYESHLFSELKQLSAENIFYVFNKDEDNFELEVEMEKNIFFFRMSIFYNISEDNWQQGVEFSRSIFDNIVGNEIINGQGDYYMKSIILDRSVLKLAKDLMMLLIQIYICADYANMVNRDETINCNKFYIANYKKFVTTCYGCVTWISAKEKNGYIMKVKIPDKCHVPCNCIESDSDVGKCVIFESPNMKCSQCTCNMNLHSKTYFNILTENAYYCNDYKNANNNEKRIAIKMLSTFFVYKEQNQKDYDVEKNCYTLLDMRDYNQKQIFSNFKTELYNEVSRLKQNSNIITHENIIVCLNELYQINHNAIIIPQFIEDTFPKDFRLEIATDEHIKTIEDVETECETCNINNETMEALRNEIVEKTQMLQNANDLNSKLIQDMQTLTERCRLNQNEEEPKENEIN